MLRARTPLVSALLLLVAGIVAALAGLALSSEKDVTPPIISDVSAIHVGHNFAFVTWTTDEPASTRVTYSYCDTAGLGPAPVEVYHPGLSMEHAVSLVPLAPGTTYSYRVASADTVGNEAVSDQYTLYTLPPP